MHESFTMWHGDPVDVCHGAHERRADDRHAAVRWQAKLKADDVDELCVVHTIRSTALIAEIFAPRAVGERLHVVLSDAQQLVGTVVWASETNVEIRFAQPIDVGELLETHDAVTHAAPRGVAPLDVSCQGWLELGKETLMVEVCDLSQGGARIAAHVAPDLGEHVVLIIQGLPRAGGEIRWGEDGKLGIAFDEPIPFDTLTAWTVDREAQLGSHGQSRRWPRYSILLKTVARLMDVVEPMETIVHNISRGGVLVTCRRGLHIGDHVQLGLGAAGSVAGRVVWVGGNDAGIEFNRTIDADHVLHPLGGRSVSPVVNHYATGRRPGLNSHKAH